MGRLTGQTLDATSSSIAFDALGRPTQIINPLGTFTYGYVTQTQRPASISYPNGQSTEFTYLNAANDLRLSEIKHLDSTPAVLSKQNYTYRPDGMIKTWTQQVGSNTPIQMALGYDPSSQLLSAVLKNTSTGDLVKQYSYAYDPAGNRTSEQAGSVVRTFAYGDGNAMSSVSSGGRIRVAGHLNEPGTVKVNGIPAGVSTNNFFESFPSVNTGTNNIPIISKDYSNNAVTNNLQVVIAPATSQTITRDANGNVTNDGNGKTYEYDAMDRLIKITQSGDVTEFLYDGLDRCVQEKFNSTVTKKWIWAGTERIAELDSGNAVIKRFFGQGVQVVGASSPADKLYYTRDHLGSIRELTDHDGDVRARYDYSPSGVTTKVSGDLDADFGFQGMYRHGSGLYLTLHRPYDPSLAAWLTRDPLQERGGLNLYQAFSNNPVNFVDPLGLSAWAMVGLVALVVLLPAAAIPALALGIFAGEILENAAGVVPQFVPCEYKVPVAIGLGLAAVVVPFLINPSAGVEGVEVRALAGIETQTVAKLNPAFQKGFLSHGELVRYLGSAGKGRAWHHIVEKTPANIARFGPRRVHNINNIVNVPHGTGSLHGEISGYFSSRAPGGGRIRDWLGNKSFEEQYDFGIQAMEKLYKP